MLVNQNSPAAEEFRPLFDPIERAEVIEALDARFGDVSDNVEEVDISTPSTVIRYTNNWKGSLEGWILTPEIGYNKPSKELPGLGDFYMTGQWVEPGGGLPAALLSGRHLTQIICKNDKIRFTSKQED